MAHELIEYYGEYLTLSRIAKKENLVDITLARHYKRTQNIYEAVKKCKAVSRGKVEKIEYNGEQLSLYRIAQKSETPYEYLREVYPEETEDIYEAIRISKEKQEENKKREEQTKDNKDKEEYYGERLELREIAKIEKVDAMQLRRYFRQTRDPYKAVFMIKCENARNKKVEIKDVRMDLYDLSMLIGIKYRDLVNLKAAGMTVKEIKKRYIRLDNGKGTTLQNKDILLEFCIKENLKFSYIYRAVQTYRRNLAEAIEQYRKDSETIPNNWIHDRYDEIFQKAEVPNIQTVVIMNELKNHTVSFEEAIETWIIRGNSKKYNLSFDWGKCVFALAKTRKLVGNEFEQQININENEQLFVEQCELEIDEFMTRIKNASKLVDMPNIGDIKLEDDEQEL